MPRRNLLRASVLCAMLFFSLFAFSQTITVFGKVTDSKDGSAVAGVNVVAKGTTKGTQTGSDGSYSLTVPSSVKFVVFSSVGYASQEVPVGSGATNVVLVATNQQLNEVVVVGYGTQRRREVTGAITKVSGEKLTTIPVPSFEAALQGKAPGVQIIQGNGLAGSGSVVRIRGVGSIGASGDPLYVVDGIPIISDQFLRGNAGAMNQNPLSSLNPADIESVEILKDAGATGIYGSRGANGVILITTKRGKSGKPQFNFNTRIGIATAAGRPKFVNTDQWLQLRQEAWVNDHKSGYADLPGGFQSFSDAAMNHTDWWDLMTQTGIINENNLSMTQGGKKLKTFANLTYSNNEGYIRANSYQRISARLNMDYNVLSNLKLSLTTGYNRGVNRRVPAAWDGGIGDVFSGALPFYPVYKPDGSYFTGGANPVRRIQETFRREIDNRFSGGLSLEYQPIKNLFVRANASIEYVTSFDDNFESANWINQANPDSGYAKRFPYWGNNINGNVTVNYLTSIGDNHRFNFLVGTEAQDYSRKSYTFSEIGTFSSAPFWENNISLYKHIKDSLLALTRNNMQPTEKALEEFTFNSFFGRINYTYKDRYALQLTARVDGSSKFGTNNKHGFFPAVSAAWTISEEKFMERYNFVDFLKLRASYGIVGNANIGSGKYYANYGVGATPYNGSPTLYLNENGFGNPDLQWETMHNFDAAVEFAFLKNKVTGELAYYNKVSTNILLEPGTPFSNGVGNIVRNLPNSRILNEGLELSLNYKVINKNDWKWSVGGNIAKNRNRVLDWELGPDAVSGGTNDTRVVEGLPLGVNYLVRFYGVDPADGLPIWLDAAGKQTKTFSLNNRVFVGSVMPDYIGGFNTSLEYKRFEFSTLFSFVIGGDIYDNSGKYQFLGVSKKFWNFREDFLDRWTQPGDIAKYPRLVTDATNYPGVPSEDQFNSTMFLHDASYLRLRELTVAYRVSPELLKKWKIKSLRFYLTGNNLLTFTKYTGGDPEITRDFENPQDRNLSPNVTYLTAPTQRTVVFGINLGF